MLMPFQKPRNAKFIPIAKIPHKRASKYGVPSAITAGSSIRIPITAGASHSNTTKIGAAIATASNRPPLRGTAVSLSRPWPLRRATMAWTPEESPITKAIAMKLAKLASPTAARAVGPRAPTIAVSTRFSTFCEAIPPMIGSERSRMVRSRSRPIVGVLLCAVMGLDLSVPSGSGQARPFVATA